MVFKDQTKWQKKNRFASLNDHYAVSNPNATQNKYQDPTEYSGMGATFVIVDDPMYLLDRKPIDLTVQKLEGKQLKKAKKEMTKDYAQDAW